MSNPLDTSNMQGSVLAIPDQFADAWELVKKFELPAAYRQAKNVVVSGMGGSALGTHVIETAFAAQLRVPVQRVQNYELPGNVGADTLVILSSYSGTTEETLACYDEAKKIGAMLVGITAGGELVERCRKDGVPFFTFDPIRYNPSGQPRSAVGYSIAAQLGIFHHLGLLTLSDKDMQQAIAHTRNIAASWTPEKTDGNLPRELVAKLAGKSSILLAGPQLFGAAHVMNNQTNETGKNFATLFEIPELNHHLLEGLEFPKSNPQTLLFVFLESALYHPRVQKRFAVTKDVLGKIGIPFWSYSVHGQDILSAMMEVVQFGGYVSYYLALQNGVNPSPVKWVDYFKGELKK